MGKATHTPAPWRFSTSGGFQVTTSQVGVLEGSKEICKISEFDKEIRAIHANGHLIAAAPDLLEALRELRQFVCSQKINNETNYLAEISLKAINKALGKDELLEAVKMANQIQEGQRIDVYEVVDNLSLGDNYEHSFSIGSHVAGRKLRQIEDNIIFDYEMFDTTAMTYQEVQKCGYYLKVKSLKGGKNG